jgi:hypothetical protein
MANKPPRPDKLPGPVKYKTPTGKPQDHPLERLHQEQRASRKITTKAAQKRRPGVQ